MGLGWQGGRIGLGWDGQAVGEGHRPARVVPFVDTVGGRRLVLPANQLVRSAGDGVGQGGGGVGVVGGRGLGAGRLRDAAATQRRDAAAVAAREDRGVGHQAGRLALCGRGGEGGHRGLWTEREVHRWRFTNRLSSTALEGSFFPPDPQRRIHAVTAGTHSTASL